MPLLHVPYVRDGIGHGKVFPRFLCKLVRSLITSLTSSALLALYFGSEFSRERIPLQNLQPKYGTSSRSVFGHLAPYVHDHIQGDVCIKDAPECRSVSYPSLLHAA